MAGSASRSVGRREKRVREVIEQLDGLDRAMAIDAYRHLVGAHLVGAAGRAGLVALDDSYPEQGVFQATLNPDGSYAFALDSASDLLEAEIGLNSSLSSDARAALGRLLDRLVEAKALDPPTGAAVDRAKRTSAWPSGATTASAVRATPARGASGVRIVRPEQNVVRRFTLNVVDERESHRREGELVDRFRAHLDASGFEHSRLAMSSERVRLYNDMYVHSPRNQLVEAKGDVRRESIRMAIGQILDYLHQIEIDELFGERPRPALLVPDHPGASIEKLLDSLGIGLIWETDDGSFQDNRSGRFA